MGVDQNFETLSGKIKITPIKWFRWKSKSIIIQES